MCFVENDDGSAPAAYKPMTGNLVNLQTLEGHGAVICGDVEGRGLVV